MTESMVTFKKGSIDPFSNWATDVVHHLGTNRDEYAEIVIAGSEDANAKRAALGNAARSKGFALKTKVAKTDTMKYLRVQFNREL